MSAALSQLLGLSEHATHSTIAKLEQLSGFHGEDNRLLSEVKMALRPKIAELGMDPDDTTPAELHHGLIARFWADGSHLEGLVGTHQSSDKLAGRLIQLVNLCDFPKEVWVLKRSVAKNLLKQQPPRRLMRVLHCRSVSSMIKREDIDKLYAALPLVESPKWLKNFYRLHSALKSTDFELRPLRIISVSSSDWSQARFRAEITKVPQLGTIVVWPSASADLTHSVKTFVNLIIASNDLRVYSLALGIRRMNSDFGHYLAKQLENGFQEPLKFSHLPISWHALQHHYGALPVEQNPFLSLGAESSQHRAVKPATVLSQLHPSFRWWADTDTLGANSSGAPVSFNLADVAANTANRASYGHHSTVHLHSSAVNELISRYIHHKGVESHLLSKLNTSFNPSKLAPALEPAVEKDLQLV